MSNIYNHDMLTYIFLSRQLKDPTAYKDRVIATGLPASPGAAVGQVVFTAEDAEAWHAEGKDVILVTRFLLILSSLSIFYLSICEETA